MSMFFEHSDPLGILGKIVCLNLEKGSETFMKCVHMFLTRQWFMMGKVSRALQNTHCECREFK